MRFKGVLFGRRNGKPGQGPSYPPCAACGGTHLADTPSVSRPYPCDTPTTHLETPSSFALDPSCCDEATPRDLTGLSWTTASSGLTESSLEDDEARSHTLYMDEWDHFDRKEEQLTQILWEEDPRDSMYVYWLCDRQRIKPAVLQNVVPFDGLHEFLQRKYGGQSYYLMIRRGKVMRFTGDIHIAGRINVLPELDIRLEIERLRRQKRQELISE